MMKKTLLLLIMIMMCVSCVQAEDAPGSWLSSVLGDELAKELRISASGYDEKEKKADGYIALIYIEGEILETGYKYDHVGTLNAIDELIDDEENSALMLYLNTPGGSLYEADELYHQLMLYKEETGRPIYAYMAQQCCSAGVYIAMAADRIAASRMTITGSVGVYMSATSQAGLFEKIGIENEYIATGENKVPGYPTLTDEQRSIYQAVVDEGFVYFKDAIASARKLTDEQMAPFLDGRLLTALNAKEVGLIDDVLYYDEFAVMISGMHANAEIRDQSPQQSFGIGSGDMLKWLKEFMQGSGAEAINVLENVRTGGLMS